MKRRRIHRTESWGRNMGRIICPRLQTREGVRLGSGLVLYKMRCEAWRKGPLSHAFPDYYDWINHIEHIGPYAATCFSDYVQVNDYDSRYFNQ